MSQELIQEIDHLRAEIQQLKEQLKDITAVELKLGELQARVEAAKTIFKEQLLSDLITEKEYIKILEVLESAQNSRETTK